MENNLANKLFLKKNHQIIHGDCQKELRAFANQVDLIVTSPPYANSRQRHYDSVAPHDYPDWFMSFHEVFWQALKPTGSLVMNSLAALCLGRRCVLIDNQLAYCQVAEPRINTFHKFN